MLCLCLELQWKVLFPLYSLQWSVPGWQNFLQWGLSGIRYPRQLNNVAVIETSCSYQLVRSKMAVYHHDSGSSSLLSEQAKKRALASPPPPPWVSPWAMEAYSGAVEAHSGAVECGDSPWNHWVQPESLALTRLSQEHWKLAQVSLMLTLELWTITLKPKRFILELWRLLLSCGG